MHFLLNMVKSLGVVQLQPQSLSGDFPPPVQPVSGDSIPQAVLVTSQYDVVFNDLVMKNTFKTIK